MNLKPRFGLIRQPLLPAETGGQASTGSGGGSGGGSSGVPEYLAWTTAGPFYLDRTDNFGPWIPDGSLVQASQTALTHNVVLDFDIFDQLPETPFYYAARLVGATDSVRENWTITWDQGQNGPHVFVFGPWVIVHPRISNQDGQLGTNRVLPIRPGVLSIEYSESGQTFGPITLTFVSV